MTELSPAEAIFFAALEKGSPQERAAYLDAACGANADLRNRVERFLAAHPQVGSFLEQPAAPPVVTSVEAPRPLETAAPADAGEGIGAVLAGRYKLLEAIGEGGMGTVWMAQQTEPVKRPVAVKLIKAGMDSKQVLARFEAERQALALMDHPNIAKVHDAGVAPDGRPFFVMELVKGVPITKFCDEHKLTPKQRLELFVPVCQAIQHAHQKGIIHRDIKPSNVLVALYDDRPVPKVIDFGVAKATGQQLTEQTLHTGLGTVVGTLEYMSPEQAGFNQLDIDTRSDVYSLGVLLYELLAGSPPFGRKELEKVGMLEMLRVIREQEPSKPSTKLSTAEGLPALAANRGTEPKRLTALVRGELDWIVMKALEKDRGRRYEAANSFAMDVQRYLADEPVAAGPPSMSYRLRKFVRRNRGVVLAACLVLLSLVAGIVAATIGLVQAKRAEGRAETALAAEKEARLEATTASAQTMSALGVLTDDVIERQFARQVKLTAEDRAFLGKVLAQFERVAATKGDSAESREIRAHGFQYVGLVHLARSEYAAALSAFREETALLEQLAAELPAVPKHREMLSLGHQNIALTLTNMDKRSEAEGESRLALALTEQLADEFPGVPRYLYDLADRHSRLAGTLLELGRHTDAEAEFRQSIRLAEQALAAPQAKPRYREVLARSHHNLSILQRRLRKFADAQAELRLAITAQTELVADLPNVPYYREALASSHGELGKLLNDLGNPADAVAQSSKANRLRQQLVADFPAVPTYRHELGKGLDTLGLQLQTLGKHAEAEVEYRRAIDLLKQLAADFPDVPDFRYSLGISRLNLGNVLLLVKRNKEAEDEFRQSVVLFKRLAGDRSRDPHYRHTLGSAHNNLSNALHNLQRYEEAEAEIHAAITVLEKAATDFPDMPEQAARLGGVYGSLGALLAHTGRAAESLEWCDKAIRTLTPVLAAEPRHALTRAWLRNGHQNRGRALLALERFDEARQEYDRAAALDDGSRKDELAKSRLLCLARTDPTQAVAEAERSVQGDKPGPAQLLEAARICAISSGHAKADAARDQYAVRAVELLRQLLARRYYNDKDMLDIVQNEKSFDALRQRQDFRAVVQLLRVSELVSRQEWKDAAAAYTELLETQPDDAQALFGRGEAYYQLNQHEKSASDFEKAMAFGARLEGQTWWHVSVAYRLTARAHHSRNNSKLRDEYYSKAIAYVQARVAENPKSAWHLNELAMNYADRAQVLHSAGAGAQAQRDFEQAAASWKKGLDVAPSDANFRSSVLRTLANKADSPAAGAAYRTVAQRALEIDPKNPDGWRLLGIAEYRAGEWKLAAEALHKALDLRVTEDAAKTSDRLYLAAALCRLDKQEEARKSFDQAVEWMEKTKPNDDGLRRIRAEVEKLLGVKK